MAAKSQTDAEVLQSALKAAKRVASNVQEERAAMDRRSDRDRWAEGQRRLADVQESARTLAERIASLTSNDQL